MSKYSETARQVLEKVGGKENVKDVYHCMTRLRFKLKNESAADMEGLKAAKGVLGAQFKEDTLQVIVGTSVDEIYKELLACGKFEEHEKLDEYEAEDVKKEGFSLKKLGMGIVNTFSNSMGPLVPLFVTLGMVNIVAAVIGPTMLNLVSDQSDLYTNFYYAGQAIIYFLPVLAAITASRYFKANTFISVALTALMLYPDLTAALSAEGGYTIYGIAAPNVTYSGQIIPALLIVWIQSYVERFLNKVIPDTLKIIGVGFVTVLIMMPLSFLVLGPIGYYIGSGLTNVVLGLYNAAGPVETAIVGALMPFLTAFGIGRPIFFACMAILFANGVEYAYMPLAMVLTNFLVMGISLGYMIRSKKDGSKQMGLTCFVSTLLGGVSEPALFGIVLPNPRTFVPILISGAVSGLYLGLTKVGYYQFGPSNVMGVIGFVSAESSANFVNGCIASALAFGIALVAMLLLYKDKETTK